jgi:DNA-binding CsgD family transcriptional regulator
MIAKTKNNSAVAEEGLIVTDLAYQPVGFDPGAAAILKDFNQQNGPAEGTFGIPEEIIQALKSQSHAEGQPFKVYIRVANDQYQCRVYPLASTDGSSARPLLALHLQRDFSTSEAVYQIAAEYDLTDREKEALLGIAMGLTSKEVAERMNISPNTVRAFVRLIMIKMGVTRRAAIISKLLPHSEGQNGDSQDLRDRPSQRSAKNPAQYLRRGSSSV